MTALLGELDQPYIVIAVIESKTEAEATDSEFIMTGAAMIQSDHRKSRCEVIVFERDGRSGVDEA